MARKPKNPLRVLVVGAHDDDCDIKFGGCATLYRKAGHVVCFLNVTNGATGHHEIGGLELAKRRAREARRAGRIIGVQRKCLDIQSNELTPELPYRKLMIRFIREFKPDLVVTHRPNDYHPDHRYTSQLVQDAAYSVTVPGVCPLVPHLQKNPVIMYCSDGFQKPYPFQADVVVAIDQVIETKMDMLNCYESQVYEWLPFNQGCLDQVPKDKKERRQWLGERYKTRDAKIAERFRDKLIETYGDEKGRSIQYAEAFETCEYGAELTEENRKRLFPFLP